MDYKVTVKLSDYFEKSKFLPFLNGLGKSYPGRTTWFKTDSLDFYELQRALEKCEIKWFRVELEG